MDKAMTEIIRPLIVLKTKLNHGVSKMLAIMIGMAKPNKLRPPATCSGVSLNAKTTVKKTRKTVAATFPDQKMLIKYTINIPRIVTLLPIIIKFTFSQRSLSKKTAARDTNIARRDSIPMLATRILRILLRRVSSGSAVEIAKKRLKEVMLISHCLLKQLPADQAAV